MDIVEASRRLAELERERKQIMSSTPQAAYWVGEALYDARTHEHLGGVGQSPGFDGQWGGRSAYWGNECLTGAGSTERETLRNHAAKLGWVIGDPPPRALTWCPDGAGGQELRDDVTGECVGTTRRGRGAFLGVETRTEETVEWVTDRARKLGWSVKKSPLSVSEATARLAELEREREEILARTPQQAYWDGTDLFDARTHKCLGGIRWPEDMSLPAEPRWRGEPIEGGRDYLAAIARCALAEGWTIVKKE